MSQIHTNAEVKALSQPADHETLKTEIGAKLTKIQSKMTSMKEEASRLAGDLKVKADENVKKLNGKYSELKNRFDGFKYSTEEKWTEHKDSFEKNFQELSTNFKDILS